MDKNAIKKYAVWARRELISRVSQKAYQYGIRENEMMDANVDSIDGKLLTDSEKKERQALIAQVKEKGFEQVIEEVAYTWFNRFSAIRFMEVNGYFPTHVRVFTNESNQFKPQIITEAINLELDGLDIDRVFSLKEADNNEELFKYLLITQCNALNKILPGMFQKITDYTELLFPDNLLREGSVIEQMIALIPEDDWKDAVQIIGWLYQYYISERHEVVVKAVGKVPVSKEDIPAATQVFTPDWIVRYMVQNSLGRLWLEGHPNDELRADWKYYLDEAEQVTEVKEQLEKIREECKAIEPQEIRFIDPCMGSGHILAYVFDVLMQIYKDFGCNKSEAVKSIVENNIFGLDIDERAAQLAYFTVMMKARQYDNRFFKREAQPHVYAICESNHLDPFGVEYFVNGDQRLKADMQTLIVEMYDAKEYGSILNISAVDFDAMFARFDEIRNDINIMRGTALNHLLPFIQVANIMSKKYDIVATNPPFLNRMNAKLKKYVLENYYDYSGDLFSVFMRRNFDYCRPFGFTAFMSPNVWMFIKTYEKLRGYIINNKSITSLVQLAKGAFFKEATVDICTFVFRNVNLYNYNGTYVRLEDFKPDMEEQRKKMVEAASSLKCNFVFHSNQLMFNKIEAAPIAFWCSNKLLEHFKNAPKMVEVSAPRVGLQTGDNNRFLRLWYEISIDKAYFDANSREEAMGTNKKWFPYNKGGEFRRWFGNRYYLVNWESDGLEIRHCKNDAGKIRSAIRNSSFYFKTCITWSDITSGSFSGRLCEKGFLFDVQGSSSFPDEEIIYYVLGFLNSSVTQELLKMLNPTLHTQVGDLSRLPLVIDKQRKIEIEELVKRCVECAKEDWDSSEISWNFTGHLLCVKNRLLSRLYNDLRYRQELNFANQRENEAKLNRFFIDIYGLQDEMTFEVEDKNITLPKVDLQRDIKSLISYAVGCMFGRYSLDVDGLAYAGGEWDASKYQTYPADVDNIIPICNDEYFTDDITGRFIEFVEMVYGAETLKENLQFIADALGGRGIALEVIRNYFLNDFFKDHCATYSVTGSGKRPIYWLFDSGKNNGFKALIYMHRYQPDTIARMRTDYIHEQQERYRTVIAHVEESINQASSSKRIKLNKQLAKLKDQETELRLYEEKIHHLADQMIAIDLDDGVKHNYEIFKDVLAKIK